MASKKSLGYYQGAAATAKTLATIAGVAVPAGANFAYVQCETKDCRWRDDGTDPTASVGMYLKAGDVLIVGFANMAKFKIIETAASTVVNITFYK